MIIVSEVQVFDATAEQQVVRGERRSVDLPTRLRVEVAVAQSGVDQILTVLDQFAAGREPSYVQTIEASR